MAPFPESNRVRSDSPLLPVRSAVIAAYLQLAGHAVVGVRLDRKTDRDCFLFESSAQAAFDKLMRAMDTLRADAERVRGAKR